MVDKLQEDGRMAKDQYLIQSIMNEYIYIGNI